MKTTYRVKGLPAVLSKPSKDEAPRQNVLFVAQSEDPATIAQLHRALGSPRLAHTFYDPDIRSKLAALWPCFTYLFPARSHGPIKPAPVHLASHLGPILPGDEDDFAVAVKNAADGQNSDGLALNHVLAAWHEQVDPPISKSSLAMSLASALFRGSGWFKKNKEKLLATLLETPEAAYIALASGAWNDHASPLLDRIAAAPPLVLQILKSPTLKQYVADTWLSNALAAHPAYRTAAASLRVPHRDDPFRSLHEATRENVFAAAIALGLEPHHSEADGWWQLVQVHGEALYWLGRTWQAGGLPMAELPRYDEVTRRLISHPRWVYHWCRDLEPLAGKHFSREIWPNPWAVELIVDLHLPKELVVDLTSGSNLDEHALWDSSILFWAAEYATS